MIRPREVTTLGAIAFCVALGQAELASADETAYPMIPAGRIDLFNGKDFTGWTFFMRDDADPAKTWSVSNGVIHCAGQAVGYLRTLQDYRDYHLTVEWRFVKVGPRADNTGALVHLQLPDKVWPPCVQVQGKHEQQGDLFLMGGAESKEHRGRDANTALPKTGPSNERAVGDWNTCEIACRGNIVRAWINGRLLNTTTECTVSSGRIGFQSEGAEFEIRRVTLEPLKPADTHEP